MATTKDVAQWMLDEILREGTLFQQNAVSGIHTNFGSEFIYYTENGNPAIKKSVRAAFRKLAKGKVNWNPYAGAWSKI